MKEFPVKGIPFAEFHIKWVSMRAVSIEEFFIAEFPSKGASIKEVILG
jgi:hypothetical protein